jgi:hypothetical protein
MIFSISIDLVTLKFHLSVISLTYQKINLEILIQNLVNSMTGLFLLMHTISNFTLSGFGLKPKSQLTKDNSKITNNKNCYQKAVGVFFHHRDVKVALEDLIEIGFPVSKISLIARDCKRYDWNNNLQICDRFDNNLLKLPEALIHLLQRYFNRGKYLTIVSGTKADVEIASAILNRRPKHAKVWHF